MARPDSAVTVGAASADWSEWPFVGGSPCVEVSKSGVIQEDVDDTFGVPSCVEVSKSCVVDVTRPA